MNQVRFILCLGVLCGVSDLAMGSPTAPRIYRHRDVIQEGEDFLPRPNFLGSYSRVLSKVEEDRFIQGDPDSAANPEAWNRRGTQYFEAGRYQEALGFFNQSIALKRDNPEAWNNKGAALARMGRHEEALPAYDTALSYNPKFAKAWNNKGTALAKLGRFREAVSAYEQLILLDPKNAEGWKNKGAVLASLGLYDEALEAVVEAHRLDPANPEIREMKEKLERRIQGKGFVL